MKKRFLSLLLALVMIAGMIPAAALAASAADGDAVATMVDEMSLGDKITQMLMVDFRKWGETSGTATDFTVMNDEVKQILADYRFGAVILFANNVRDTEQSFTLAQDLQAAAIGGGGLPMLLAVDQEGGSVYRLGSGTALPGNMALGATYAANGTVYAEKAGEIIGSELGALGINTNLAPVVDVNSNANNPVIGLRSYSDDAVMVGELAAAQIEGMARYGVVGCAKHFPGHGDTEVDSHYGLPMVDKPLSVLQEMELKPYEVAISKGIDMIMTAHILYPQLESDTIVSDLTGEAESLPATMSDDILTGLLKEDMGFEGIIVTDAMNMAGITYSWDPVQACVIAIQAGVDMICMPTELYCKDDLVKLDGIIAGIEAAIDSGAIPMSRIDDAVTRILTVKNNRGILDYDPADYSLEEAMAVVGCDDNRAMEREIAAAAITVVKNENNVLPLEVTENSKVLMLVPYNNERAQTIMAWNRAKEAGLIPEGAAVDYFRFNGNTISDELQTKLDWADTYIILTEVSSTARMGYKHWLSAMPNKLCDYADANGKIAVIASVDKPYDVQMYPNADAIVAGYGCKGSSVDPTEAIVGGTTGSELAYGPNIIAAVEVVLGTYGAQGKLPVNIPRYDLEENMYTEDIVYARGHGLTYNAKLPNQGPTVTYTNASISLAGDIGVNYYAVLSDDVIAHEGAYMQFTVAGQTQTIPVSEAEIGADGTYRFSCKVAAKQMTEDITGQIYLADGTAVGEAKVYSVKAYCDAAIDAYEGYEAYADLVSLMKAMLNYGGYSQVQLGYNTEKLANAGLDMALPEVTADDVAAYAHGAAGAEAGISVASVSLLLESTTTIRFYFELDGTKSIDAYTFYVDGVETTPVLSGDNQYYVDKVDVAAKDLDEMVTVTVGGLTARYCGLSYVRLVAVQYAAHYPANLVNVAKALYAYNQAANAYFA